ncbi:MAG: hypothetical protein LRY71_10540 [Bacillaceae bacterium]|nr:hypothetical protein [Bacillaceae bacterium]
MYVVDDFAPYMFLLLLPSYFYSALRRSREWEIKLFLYVGLTWVTFNLVFFFSYFDLGIFTPGKAFSISTILMMICSFMVTDAWKKRMTYYMVPLSLISFFPLMSFEVHGFELLLATCMLVICSYLLPKKLEIMSIVPLLVYVSVWFMFTIEISIVPLIIIYGITIGSLQLVGIFKHRYMIGKDEFSDTVRIDWYTMVGFLLLFTFQLRVGFHELLLVKVLPSLFLVFLLYLQITRVTSNVGEKLFTTFTVASAFIPYYIVVGNVNVPMIIRLELLILPVLVFISMLKAFVFQGYKEIVTIYQSLAVALVAIILMADSLFANTVLDALIIGSLSVCSFVFGMLLRVKSYFFAGFVTLFLTVVVQTRSLWGNLPWWLYLFTAGILLFGVAAFYEWQRQHKTTLKMKREKLIQTLKEWD